MSSDGRHVAHTAAPRVQIVTVSHRGDDARIVFRQVGALARGGWTGTLVAPEPVTDLPSGFTRQVIRRAAGRRRVGSWLAAWRAVRSARGSFHLILVHDLEAVLPVKLAFPRAPIVWDVHEDLAASVVDRDWIPAQLRLAAGAVTSGVEWLVRRRTKLLLAEHSYAERLGPWPVVPNTAVVPELIAANSVEEPPVALYLGRISVSRGLRELIEVGRRVKGLAVVRLVGAPDAEVRRELEEAHARGDVEWLGPLPNPEALIELSRATVGLCLLHDLPNFERSMPTKVFEYFAHALPVISTPLPLAVGAISEASAGTVVEFGDVGGVVESINAYADDPERQVSEGRRGHRWVQENHDWTRDGADFERILRSWALPTSGQSGESSEIGQTSTG